MISFIQNHWKKFILALCALFWSGRGDDDDFTYTEEEFDAKYYVKN